MTTVKRTYVGIHDAVTVTELGGRVVQRGETVDVDSSVAGRAPKGKPGDDGYDPGEGLDAQPENWTTPGQAKKQTSRGGGKRAAKKAAKAAETPPAEASPDVNSNPPEPPVDNGTADTTATVES